MAPKKKKEPVEQTEVLDEEEERDQAIAALFKSANKNFGAGTLIYAEDNKVKVTPRISTGILPLDYALGGGVPVGRISLFYGHKSTAKTTNILRIIGNAQKMCSNCWTDIIVDGDHKTCECKNPRKAMITWLDVEGAWDHEWSSKFLKIDDSLMLAQPSSAEETIDLAHAALKAQVDVLVIDSIAFMAPLAEQEKSSQEHTVGTQARLMGNAVRKFVSTTNELGKAKGRRPTIIFTNQIRMKVGVMYGCFHGDDIVSFADGRRIPIRNVVQQRMSGDVLSYDRETRTIVPKKITNWFNNGKLDRQSGERWLSFLTTGAGGLGGAIGFSCTPNHVLFRPDGAEVHAGEVLEGESLMSYVESRVMRDSVHRDVILGSLIGDGGLKKNGLDTASLTLTNQEQPEYLEWKCSMLPMLGMRPGGNDFRPRMDSDCIVELKIEHDRFYPTGKGYRQIPADLELTPLMAAVWYMDDGWMRDRANGTPLISIKRFKDSPGQIMAARTMLSRFIGCDIDDVTYHPSNAVIEVSAMSAPVFFAKISMHVIPCMRHKVPVDSVGYVETTPGVPKSVLLPYPVIVRKINIGSERKHRDLTKYDLEVDGGGSYVIGANQMGVVVHNSPETVSGGLACGFATSVEVKTSTGKYDMDEDVSGKPMMVENKAKITKNKTAPPQIEVEWKVALMKTEVKAVGDIMDEDWAFDMGEKTGIISVAPQRVEWDGKTYRGRSLLEKFWMENPAEYTKFKDQIMPVLLLI